MTPEIDPDRMSVGDALPRLVALVSGIGSVALGAWAMADPHSFFEAVARFEPYNQHFLQDVGAFQIGLGVVLLLACLSGRADGLAVALLGVGAATTLHTVSHVIGRELGGVPDRDIPTFAVIAAILLAAGGSRWRHSRAPTRSGARRA
jgi:hypothetical protein